MNELYIAPHCGVCVWSGGRLVRQSIFSREKFQLKETRNERLHGVGDLVNLYSIKYYYFPFSCLSLL